MNFVNYIQLHITTIRNSNSNAPVERFHSTILDSIRCLKTDYPNKPLSYLIRIAVINYNNSIHSNTKFTPFEILFGHLNKNTPFELSEEQLLSDYISDHEKITSQHYNQIKINIETNKNKTISNRNKDKTEPQPLTANDKVLIKNADAIRH